MLAFLVALNIGFAAANFAYGNRIIGSLCLASATFILAGELLK